MTPAARATGLQPAAPPAPRRRWAAAGALGAVVAALAAASGHVAPAGALLPTPAPAAPPARPISWLAMGDSYSSGDGTTRSTGPCGLSPDAYPPVARQRLVASGFPIGTFVHAACSGHTVPGVQVTSAPGRDTLLGWADRLAGVAPDVDRSGGSAAFDLVTLTIGGNDVGFGEVTADCFGDHLVGPPAGPGGRLRWTDLGALHDGCRATLSDVEERASSTLAGGGLLYAPGRRGTLADLYAHLATTAVRAGGHLVVLGYPRLLAPPGTWPWHDPHRCWGLPRPGADLLNAAAERLAALLRHEVEAADRRSEPLGRRVVFLDVDPLFDGHRLCDPEPWLHGLHRPGTGEPVAALHPGDRGHAAVAAALAARVATLDWR